MTILNKLIASITLFSLSIYILCSLLLVNQTSAGVIDDVSKAVKDIKDSAEKKIGTDSISVCLTNDNCNTEFFRLDNYCCGLKCCTWFSYVTRNDNQYESLKDTIKQPRAINIIVFVVGTLIVSALVSILISFICCFFGCSNCCGSRKYSIVSH